ncbi:MAG: twin-arginine translocase subunit TatC [Austwickia sp.]|nr:twin-arginine translocase subunit TatC [Austwickia sp.]MBK8435279.1 twin-arginine translocase subunit TatC [Austwickia sp.]
MPLAAHLRELRNRFFVAVGAIALATVPAWMFYEPVLDALLRPLRAQRGNVNFTDMMSAFATQLQVSLFLSLLVSSPVWLYQIWAFVVPGLTRRERRGAIGFVAVAVPLFMAGCYLAYLTLPKAVEILLSFLPPEAQALMPASDYFGWVTKFILAFGLAFLLPIFLIALNLAGVLPASVMLRGWRIAVIVIFVFAAVMTPTPDPYTMLGMALPMVFLYFSAYGVARLIERRRAKRRPDWVAVPDDQASAL